METKRPYTYVIIEIILIDDRRVSCLLLSTINMIIYMGNVEPSVYDKDDTIVNDIWNAS